MDKTEKETEVQDYFGVKDKDNVKEMQDAQEIQEEERWVDISVRIGEGGENLEKELDLDKHEPATKAVTQRDEGATAKDQVLQPREKAIKHSIEKIQQNRATTEDISLLLRTEKQKTPIILKDRGNNFENLSLKTTEGAKKLSQTLPQQDTTIGKDLLVVSRYERKIQPLTPSPKPTGKITTPAQTLLQKEKKYEEIEVVSRAKKQTKTMIPRDKETEIENTTTKQTERARKPFPDLQQRESKSKKGIKVVSRAHRKPTLNILTDIESKLADPRHKPTARATKLVQTVLQQSTATFSSGGYIELLVAEYADDGSVFFRKSGRWNISEWVFDGPLHAISATHFGGRTITLTTIHVSVNLGIDG